jgi:transcriptional regulator with XRE-family HTH domain
MGDRTLRKPSKRMTKILSNNLRSFRKTKNISQEELAALCNVHRTYIGSIERGERNVTLSTLEALSAALGVSVPQLLTKGSQHDDPS